MPGLCDYRGELNSQGQQRDDASNEPLMAIVALPKQAV
jgi:hypothetical protein